MEEGRPQKHKGMRQNSAKLARGRTTHQKRRAMKTPWPLLDDKATTNIKNPDDDNVNVCVFMQKTNEWGMMFW